MRQRLSKRLGRFIVHYVESPYIYILPGPPGHIEGKPNTRSHSFSLKATQVFIDTIPRSRKSLSSVDCTIQASYLSESLDYHAVNPQRDDRLPVRL